MDIVWFRFHAYFNLIKAKCCLSGWINKIDNVDLFVMSVTILLMHINATNNILVLGCN